MVSAIESSRASDMGASHSLSLLGVQAAPSWEGSRQTLIARAGRQAHENPSQEPVWHAGGSRWASSDPANPPRASWEGDQGLWTGRCPTAA